MINLHLYQKICPFSLQTCNTNLKTVCFSVIKPYFYMLRFAISAQKVAMLRPSNIRQNCFAYDDPRYVKTSITHDKIRLH